MDKNIENKLGARGTETKAAVTVETCPGKTEHRSYLGRRHPMCGAEIPLGPYTGDVYERFFEVRQPQSEETGTSPGVAALWEQYAAANAERERLAGEALEADRQLWALRREADDARYESGNSAMSSEAGVLAKAAALRARRDELAEARDAARERSEMLLLERSKVEAREAAERRRLEAAASERPGLIERARRLVT